MNSDTIHVATKFSEITDGLSNTIALGERSYKDFTPAGSPYRIQCGAAVIFGNEWNTNRENSRRNPVYGNSNTLGFGEGHINSIFTGNPTAPGNNGNAICGRGAASFHAGGAQFAMVDGSIRFITETIDWNPDIDLNSAYEYLGAIADGNVAPSP
jgi:prepilin-type processing-associated H-X9-DG protein